jgi:hypothetical protein
VDTKALWRSAKKMHVLRGMAAAAAKMTWWRQEYRTT